MFCKGLKLPGVISVTDGGIYVNIVINLEFSVVGSTPSSYSFMEVLFLNSKHPIGREAPFSKKRHVSL